MKAKPQRAVLLMFLLLLTGAGLRCIQGPLEPVMPSTDTELNIPIIDETSTFANLVVQGPIVNNGDGTVSYVTSQQMKPVPIDSMPVFPNAAWEQVSLGSFKVAVPPKSISVDAGTLNLPPGSYPSLPATQGTAPPQPMDISDSIGYVTILSGTLTLQVQNTLPVPIDFPNGLGLRNNSVVPFDTTTLGVFAFGSAIPANQSRTAVIDLAGKTVRGKLQLDSIAFSTPGSGGSPVTINPTDGLTFSFSSTLITADSAGAVIPFQNITNYPPGSLFTVDDSTVIQAATFRSGRLRILFTNTLDVGVNMAVKINEFISTVTGQPFDFALNVPKKSKDSVTVSLDSIRIMTTAGALGTTLTFAAGINTIGSAGAIATITRNDLVRVDLTPLESFNVKSVTGKIKPTRVNVNLAQGSAFDLGDLAKKMTGTFIFDSVKVKLLLPMTGGFPTDYALKFFVKNTARGIYDSVTLPPDKITGLYRIHPEIANPPPTIVLDKSTSIDSLLGKFFPVMPDSFFVRGSLLIDPPDVFAGAQTYTITDTSRIYPGLDLNFPARFGLLNGSLQNTSALTAKSGGDIIPKDITKSVKQATLNVEATNGFPAQMSLQMSFLGRDSVGVRDTLLRITPGTLIQAAQIDANGYPVAPRVTTFPITLSNADMLNLNRADSVFVRLGMQTSGGGTVPVQFRAFDRVRIRASGRIIYTINKQ